VIGLMPLTLLEQIQVDAVGHRRISVVVRMQEIGTETFIQLCRVILSSNRQVEIDDGVVRTTGPDPPIDGLSADLDSAAQVRADSDTSLRPFIKVLR
jgi:hypothetical protein